MLSFMKSIAIFIFAGNGVAAADVEVAKLGQVAEATSDAPEGNEPGITSMAGIRGAALFPFVKEEGGCSGIWGCRKGGCACGNWDEQADEGEGYTGSKNCCWPRSCTIKNGGSTGDIWGKWCE
jgi:hypothetical protein